LLLITACGSRVPFKKQQPLENSALVYVYVPENVTADEDTDVYEYSIRINNKRHMERITEGEYMVFNLKPLTIDISATRAQIEEHKETIKLKAGHIYYFKIQKQDDATFTFERVEQSIASKEIAKTGLAGSSVESEENIITEFISPKEDKKEDVMVKPTQPTQPAPAQTTAATPLVAPTTTPAPTTTTTQAYSKRATASKLDEIKEAYKMKKDGLISDEEFQTIKSEILAK
jgi:hypothetical protein